MVFNAPFNNISAISWRSVLLVEQTGVFGVSNRPPVCHWQTISHNVVSPTPRQERVTNGWVWCLFCIRRTRIVNYHDSQPTSLWSYSLKLCAHEKKKQISILLSMVWPDWGLEPMIYHTQGEHATHYTVAFVYSEQAYNEIRLIAK